MERNCANCRFVIPYAKATVEGMEYSFVCTANEKTFVDITELVKIDTLDCIDFQKRDEDDKLQLSLEVKDMQKIAIQFNEIDKGEE